MLKSLHDSHSNEQQSTASIEKCNALLRSLDLYEFEVTQIEDLLMRCNREMGVNLDLQAAAKLKNASVEKNISNLQKALEEQQKIRSNHQEYESVAKDVNAYQSREQLHSLLDEIENQARVVREETEQLSEIIQLKKKKLETVLSILGEIQQSGVSLTAPVPTSIEDEEEMSRNEDDLLD